MEQGEEEEEVEEGKILEDSMEVEKGPEQADGDEATMAAILDSAVVETSPPQSRVTIARLRGDE